jgi:hypothetical protein
MRNIMARRGRRPVLDETKRREIAALLSAGCSQRAAARYVGCARSTIAYTLARDEAFAAMVRKALCNAEVTLIRNIRNAAKKEQYWRAAAWMLERAYPERYARRGPDVITVEQIAGLLSHFSQIVAEEVPVARFRQNALRRLEELSKKLTGKLLAIEVAATEPPPEAEPPLGEETGHE